MDRGGSRLTALGLRLLRAAEGGRPGANHWTGTFETGPPPSVRLDGSASLEVSFHARDHERVTVEVEPEAFVLALRPVELSARNRLAATVEEVRPHADGTAMVTTRWRGRRVRVVVTIASVKRMRLAPGRRLYCYLKATAVRRVREASLGPRGLASTRRARR